MSDAAFTVMTTIVMGLVAILCVVAATLSDQRDPAKYESPAAVCVEGQPDNCAVVTITEDTIHVER